MYEEHNSKQIYTKTVAWGRFLRIGHSKQFWTLPKTIGLFVWRCHFDDVIAHRTFQ